MTASANPTPVFEHDVDAVAQFAHRRDCLAGAQARGIAHSEVEALVQAQGTELLRRLIQGHLDQRGREEPLCEQVVGADGKPWTPRRAGCRRTNTRMDCARCGWGRSSAAGRAHINLQPKTTLAR